MAQDVPWRREFDAARDPYTARNALGVVAPSGGGPPVGISGTPANCQWAHWTSSGTIEGVPLASTPWVLKAGDTMTGALTISTTVTQLIINETDAGSSAGGNIRYFRGGITRWQLRGCNGVEPGGGANSGSDFAIFPHKDDGTFAGFTSLLISRLTGLAQVQGDPTVALGIATKQYVDARIKTVAIQKFTASGTYTPTSGMKYCTIECIGGGGAGGGVLGTANFTGCGGGGGSGGYSRVTVSAATIGASQTVTRGTGGTGVTNAAGGAGTATSVGSLCVANGGGGGFANNNVSAAGGSVAGAVGDIAAAGAPGAAGCYFPAATATIFSGCGGSSIFGGGGVPTFANSGQTWNGNAASAYGSGGSGATTNNVASNGAGGAGSSGLVIITEYIG